MSDDEFTLGTITGTATFEKVKIREGAANPDKVEVAGRYGEDQTTYRTDEGRVFVGGLRLTQISRKVVVEPEDEDGWVWVEATDGELHITSEEPSE